MDLTPEQSAAVSSKARIVVLTAGAGTGKTTTLVARYLAAVQAGLDAGQPLEASLAEVLAVTFTRKAAREVRRRAAAALADTFPGSEGLIEAAPISTIDSLAARLLRLHGAAAGIDPAFRVLDEIESRVRFRTWAREALEDPSAPVVEAAGNLEELLDRAYTVITQARAQGVDPAAFAASVLRTGASSVDGTDDLSVERSYDVAVVGADLQVGPPSPEGQLIARLYGVLDGRLRAENLFDFPRLLFELDRLLVTRGDALPKYREVLVDEYQDTTPLQERVLRRLASGVYFAVGDAKQSIYRFRGAAPRHLAALASTPNAARLSLTRNFRSTREILDGINRMFIAPLAPYEPLLSERSGGGAGMEILPSVSKEAEPERVVRRVRALLAEGRTPGQIAVLLRSPRTHGLAFERAFREAAIRFGSSGGGGYYDRPEVRDLVALLRAVRNPLDDQALVRVLRGPLYRAPNSALAQAAALRARTKRDSAQPLFTVLDRAEHPAVRRAGAFLAEMTAQARRLDLPGLIHSLLRDSGYQGYLQTLPEDVRMRMEANLRKFYVLAEAFAGRHLFTGLEEFLDYVVEVGRQETVESEAPLDPAAGEEEAVRIMSVHQAKGLEFPVVIVAGLSDKAFPKQYRADPGWRFTAAGGLRPNSDAEAKAEEKAMHEAEEIRLLYVAMTRARERLILSGVPGRPDEENGETSYTASVWPWLCTVAGELLPEFAGLVSDARHVEMPGPVSVGADLQVGPPLDPVLIAAALSRIAAAYPAPASADPGSLTVSMLASYALCPLQYRYRYVLRLPSDPGVDGTGSSEGVDEALLGTILHRTLEEYVREKKRLGSSVVEHAYDVAVVGAGLAPAPSSEWLTARFTRMCEGFGVGGGDALRRYARQALPALEKFPGSPYDRPPSEIRDVEAPFALVLDGNVIRGALDRLDRLSAPVVSSVGADLQVGPVVDEVIDYKSNRREEPERYRFALSLYGLAAERIFGCRSPKLTLLYLRTGHAVEVAPDPDAEPRAVALAGGIRAGEFPARPGPECGYCPYRKICPSAPVWARRRPLRAPRRRAVV